MMSSFEEYSPKLKKELEELVSEPKIVGYFSVDGDRNYLPNASRLMYYKPPPTGKVSFDLNHGIESAVRRPDDTEDGRISHLLLWMKDNYPAIIESRRILSSKEKPKFACSCGLLTTMLCSPYTNPKLGWIVCAAKRDDMIYMCRFRTPEENETYDDMPKFTSWGYKFEQYLLSDAPDEIPDTSKPVIEGAEFRCLFQRRFGDYSVLFTAEMDGLVSKKKLNDPLPLNDLRFVEFKTHRIIKNANQDWNFRTSKILRWWAQSFVVGNEKVVCGFRDQEGIVHSVESYSLPALVELSRGHWNPGKCVNACNEFLKLVARTVVNTSDKMIYKFEKKPYSNRVVTEELSPQSEYAFMGMS